MFQRKRKGTDTPTGEYTDGAESPVENVESVKPGKKLKNFLAHNKDCDPNTEVLLMSGSSTDHTEFTNALSKGVAMGRIGGLYMSNTRLWFDGGMFNKFSSGSRTIPFGYIDSISKATTGLAKISNAIDIHIRDDVVVDNDKWGFEAGKVLTFSFMKGRDEWFNYLQIMVDGFKPGSREEDKKNAQESVLLQKMIKQAQSGHGSGKHISYSIGEDALHKVSSKKEEKGGSEAARSAATSEEGPGAAVANRIPVGVQPDPEVLTTPPPNHGRRSSGHRRVLSDSSIPASDDASTPGMERRSPLLRSDADGSSGGANAGTPGCEDSATGQHHRQRSTSLVDLDAGASVGNDADESSVGTGPGATVDPALQAIGGTAAPSNQDDDDSAGDHGDSIVETKDSTAAAGAAVPRPPPKKPSSSPVVAASPTPTLADLESEVATLAGRSARHQRTTSRASAMSMPASPAMSSSSVIPPRTTTNVVSVEELAAMRKKKPSRGLIATAFNLDWEETAAVGNFKPSDFGVFLFALLVIDFMVYYYPVVRIMYILGFNYVFYRWVNRQQMHTDRIGHLQTMLERLRSGSAGGLSDDDKKEQ
eukprot:TRINITY_DN6825_c0_g1_i1.p1 TRINITY_DN6825_c0_g1~~TRINITY_DN6825_c0_g1_i1.p1  ORF type:complete len:590 (-),score=110.12 TRINITY_DN6825_c0_g1_i1:92-1861(-)